MDKANKWMEKFWLLFAIAALIFAIYQILFGLGWTQGAKYLYFPAIAFFWWLFRKKMRERVERMEREKLQNKSH